jgi:hypothetical protein
LSYNYYGGKWIITKKMDDSIKKEEYGSFYASIIERRKRCMGQPTWFLTRCDPKSSFLLVCTIEKLFKTSSRRSKNA